MSAVPLHRPRRAIPAAALLISALLPPASALAAATCEARSGDRPPRVVELYTSEGCSSCPPADRWLSSLPARPDLLPLAFHVNYWNRLGWADRFASQEATQRQYRLARALGAPNVYTPQVVAQGQDWRRWPALPPLPSSAPVQLRLARDGETVRAEIAPAAGPGDAAARPGQLSGYWALLEDGHRSRVTAGENSGHELLHDHVVRLYEPVDAWRTGEPQRFTLTLPPGEPGRPRRVAFVVQEPASMRPVQALALALEPGC